MGLSPYDAAVSRDIQQRGDYGAPPAPQPATSQGMGLRTGINPPSGGDIVLRQPGAAIPPVSPIPSQPTGGSVPSGGGSVPPELTQEILRLEGSKDDEVSPKGAIGKGQIMPETGARYGASREQLFDPQINARVRDQYLGDLWRRYPGDPTAVKVAYNAGEGVADKWLASGRNNAVLPAETQRYIDPNHLANMMTGTVGGSAIQQQMAGFNQMVGRLAEEDRARYEEIANKSDPGSKERQELMEEARARAAHYRQMYEDFAKNPPPEKPIDALQNFGSVGTMLALLIGGMGRHHMNGALAAAGAMMQAAQANNHEQFERQYKIWDHQSTTAFNLARLETDEVRNLLEDRRMAENDKRAALNSFFQEHQMTFQAMQLQAGMMEHVLTTQEAMQRAVMNANFQKLQFAQMRYEDWLRNHPDATEDEKNQEAKFLGVIPAGSTGAT